MTTGHLSGNLSGSVRLTSPDSTGRTTPPLLGGVSGCPVSCPFQAEGLEVVWSAALYRAGRVRGLSSWPEAARTGPGGIPSGRNRPPGARDDEREFEF
jgi:hypothetical protein